jgi:hypothetical protein
MNKVHLVDNFLNGKGQVWSLTCSPDLFVVFKISHMKMNTNTKLGTLAASDARCALHGVRITNNGAA